MLQRLFLGLMRLVPTRLKLAALGPPENPSSFANAVHRLVNMFPGPRVSVMPCEGVLKGYRMKADWFRHRAFLYGTWEPKVVQALKEAVVPGGVAVDVGAHVGFYTLLFCRLVGPHGRVIAFEPLAGNFATLRENLELNRCGQAVAIRAAVLDRSGEIEYTVPREEPLPGSVSLFEDYGTKPERVAAVTLDDFLRAEARNVDYIKMDVEGAETAVLRGALETLNRCHPVLIVEIHGLDSTGNSHPALDMLDELGYQVRYLDRSPWSAHVFAKWEGVGSKHQ